IQTFGTASGLGDVCSFRNAVCCSVMFVVRQLSRSNGRYLAAIRASFVSILLTWTMASMRMAQNSYC
ncbi:MAG TPA: hypothetical protein VLE70_18460, partial [Anaerolineae bacterium]|nr:hypothetical protein [Anaerolineae bacterium]